MPRPNKAGHFSEMDIGQQLKCRRLKLGLTQQQVADQTGHSKAYVSDLERGRKSPSIDTLLPFLNALGGQLRIEWQG